MTQITYRDVVEYLLSHVIQSSRVNGITHEQAMERLFKYLADNINDEHVMYLNNIEAEVPLSTFIAKNNGHVMYLDKIEANKAFNNNNNWIH